MLLSGKISLKTIQNSAYTGLTFNDSNSTSTAGLDFHVEFPRPYTKNYREVRICFMQQQMKLERFTFELIDASGVAHPVTFRHKTKILKQ